MKKKFTISLALSLITLMGFSQSTTEVQTCPTGFGRNNGQGTCGNQAQIKMFYLGCPTTPPYIDSIYVAGVKLNVHASAPDMSNCKKGYVSYCLDNDIPPVSSLLVYFSTGTTSDKIVTACTVSSGPSAGPTPVILTSFDADRSGNNSVTVNWKTEQEINSKGFEIQRSSDNINFETVAFVSSKTANSSLAQYYSFTDNSNNITGTSFYRIKMIDLDNTFAFSSIKTVKGTGFKADINVFPNPAPANTKITIGNLSETSSIRVFDNTGRLVQQITSTGTSVDLNHLQKGNYFIKITGQQTGSSTVKKLSVIN